MVQCRAESFALEAAVVIRRGESYAGGLSPLFSDVRDTGMVFRARDCRVLEAWGQLPHLMRAERREVSVPAKGDAKTTVWALAGDGTRRHAVKSVRTADAVVFTADVAADPQCATYLYEVVRE